MLRKSIQIISFIAFLCSIVWLIYKPAFDSISAAIVTLASFLSSFLLDKNPNKPSNTQSQNVSSGSTGIQAGGDVKIGDKNAK